MRRLGVCLLFVFGLLGAGEVRPAAAEPPHTHEILYTKPSGFWTSNLPAEHGAYRWRLLGIGVGVLAVTGFFLLRTIKRANASRG